MPSLLLTNANHVSNKLDDLYLLCDSLSPSVVAITETWLSPNITNDAISINNYHVYRKDRRLHLGGGIMLYVHNDISSKQLAVNDDDSNYEILFVSLRPKLLPRPFTVLIVCVVYCPPSYNADERRSLVNCLINSVDKIYRDHPQAAVIICGDFNQLDTSLFNKHLLLQQFVRTATRGRNILDKVFINSCKTFYCYPAEILPPLGKSDHCCIFIKPKCRELIPDIGWRSVFKRVINNSVIDTIGRQLSVVNWTPLYRMCDVQQQADYFYNIVNTIVDSAAPIREIRSKCNDRPWITPYFKKIVIQRNLAHRLGNLVVYRKLRNKVNRLARNLKKDFYFHQVENFKSSNPSKWWKNIKLISGFSSKAQDNDIFTNIHFNNENIDTDQLANIINNFFISCTANVPRLPIDALNSMRSSLGEVPDDFIVSEYSVFDALSKLKSNKSTGPDNLPNSLLKSIADLIAAPICSIINSSIRYGTVPNQWKLSRVTPLPKIHPPVHIESDIRPISITSPLSKIAESFLCKYFNYYFNDHLDINQFGCSSGRSTTLALIKLTHFLFTSSDQPDVFCRILFVDFKKAFDLINHNILLQKMCDLNIPPHLTTWFLSFLCDRSQFVSINSCSSNVAQTNAGTPQGTLSGPLDFKLLINDLKFDDMYIKYVDDTTAATVSEDPLDDSMQNAANKLCSFCVQNHMFINVPKTKEMLIYFGHKYPTSSVPNVRINDGFVERVSTYKLLGVVFNDKLTWNDHIDYIINKASKRIFCISQLIRARVSESDIVIIYSSIVRSILEYCCEVWHAGLSSRQSRDIERIQKRCLRIIFPQQTYTEALTLCGLERLDCRRERRVRELFDSIKKPGHVLHELLVPRQVTHNVRTGHKFYTPIFRTKRARHDFLNYCLFKYN